MPKITFNNQQSPFFKALKGKVDAYFSQTGLHRSGNRPLLLKASLLLASAITCYVVLVFFTPPAFVSILLCMWLGVNLASIGFNVMHEGGHQSFSRYRWLNTLAAYSLNLLGGTAYFWKIKHNINHHTYTNLESLDADLDVKPFMRLHPDQPHRRMHRFQHRYAPLLYSISYIAWVFYNDFKRYFGTIAPGAEAHQLAIKEHLLFWLTKLGYVTLYLALPIYQVGLTAGISGFLLVTIACGLTISTIFQLAHVVEGTHFPQAEQHLNRIEQEWAIHQVTTTANFATGNQALSWLLGGLNFQVEHHLFPKISHIHYPQINRMVKETCQEFGVTYLEYPTFSKALQSHFQKIKELGRTPHPKQSSLTGTVEV